MPEKEVYTTFYDHVLKPTMAGQLICVRAGEIVFKKCEIRIVFISSVAKNNQKPVFRHAAHR